MNSRVWAMALLALAAVIIMMHFGGTPSDLGGGADSSNARPPRQLLDLGTRAARRAKRKKRLAIRLERWEKKHACQAAQQYRRGRGAGVCTSKDLEALVVTISADPKTLGARPLSIAGSRGGEIHFGGLDGDLLCRAFLNTRTAIYGDSTLVKYYKKVYSVLPWVGNNSLTFKRVGLGLFSPLDDDVLSVDDSPLADISDRRPKVILTNVGLHLLHMMNYGRDVNHILPWLKYEEYLEKVVRTAEASGAEVVLLKTTNFVCDKKIKDEWKVGLRKYSGGDRRALDRCFDSYRQMNPDTISNDNIKNYCKNGVINQHGSDLLNERLYRFVADTKVKLQLSNSTLKLEVFNDHDMQSCETTEDARHHGLMSARVRLLGNHLDCLYNWDGLFKGPS